MKTTSSRCGCFLCLLMVACACSCTPRAFETEGFAVVQNRLRLSPRPIEYPSSNGVILIAAENGRLPADLVLHGFDVKKGDLTFFGDDGAIRLLEGNRLEVEKKGHERLSFSLGASAVVMKLLDGDDFDNRQGIQFQRVILPSQAQSLEARVGKTNYWGMSPSLISSYSNDFFLITIPYAFSPDFHGDKGKATIESNWYEF